MSINSHCKKHKVSELKKLCSKKKLSTSGKKSELCNRLGGKFKSKSPREKSLKRLVKEINTPPPLEFIKIKGDGELWAYKATPLGALPLEDRPEFSPLARKVKKMEKLGSKKKSPQRRKKLTLSEFQPIVYSPLRSRSPVRRSKSKMPKPFAEAFPRSSIKRKHRSKSRSPKSRSPKSRKSLTSHFKRLSI